MRVVMGRGDEFIHPGECTKYRAKGTIVIEGTIVSDWRKKSHARKGIPK